MKRWILFTGIVALGVAAVVVSERRKVDATASPAAMLYLVADTEQELTRMPVRFMRMSDAEEIRIGDEIASMYGHPATDDSNRAKVDAVENYLKQVGEPLAARANRKLPYHFHYIPDHSMVNAFALPGGHVYVGAGLLALMDSEDELANVLGHEIEHVDHYHCADRAQQEQALRHLPLGGLVAIPVMVFEAGYSKDQELEADREGTRLAVQAGYSANGAVRMFEAFDRMYRRYMGQERSKPLNPQDEVADVATQTLEGYFRSHPLPSERIAQIQKLIASERWATRAERDLAVAYFFQTELAETTLDGHKYQEAERLASLSLKMHADQPAAWNVLARAQFAQANFAGAAAAYRNLLEENPRKVELVQSYAAALAAADRQKAAGEFRSWLASIQGEKPRDGDTELAGLTLLAGDSTPAHNLAAHLQLSSEGWAPDYLGELGWWYYLSGDYAHATQLLADAVQQRPGASRLWLRQAWAEIEIRRYSDALQTINNGSFEQPYLSERTMAQAVAFWQASETDEALRDYEQVISSQPEWENSAWVKELYSPLVAKSVDQMRAERENRRKARLAEKH